MPIARVVLLARRAALLLRLTSYARGRCAAMPFAAAMSIRMLLMPMPYVTVFNMSGGERQRGGERYAKIQRVMLRRARAARAAPCYDFPQ